MNIQNTFDLIPTDLLHEIFSRLPAKSVGRCRCVSKKLASTLGSEDFKQLFFTRSLTRPCLLFAARDKENWVFYSSSQPQNLVEKSSLVVRADFHNWFDLSYASGLFYVSGVKISTNNTSGVLCNPVTGQYVILPKLRIDREPPSFLGFDPINKQFKLLVINARVNNEEIHFILTVETGKMKWRTIQCPSLCHYSFRWSSGICINGVLYYLAKDIDERPCMIVCFDVRTETFKFKYIDIDVDGDFVQLINYKGKLGITVLKKEYSNETITLYMLVLDVEKPEWSKYTLPSTIEFDVLMYVVGMTFTDEIVLSTVYKPIYLYYFNLEKNSLQSVEVQGLANDGDFVQVLTDHVEDLYVNDAKYFKSNIHANLREAPSVSDEEDDD